MKKSAFTILFSILALTSCTGEDSEKEHLLSENMPDDRIIVSFGTRAVTDENDMDYPTSPDEEKITFRDSFQEGDIIYISQMGTSADPILFPYCTDIKKVKLQGVIYNADKDTTNMYVYEYAPNTVADWDNGYNFVPYVNSKGETTPLNWSYIRSLGSVGNAFSFYALFFPDLGKSTSAFKITQWQNRGVDKTFETFKRSMNIMGAYHATSSLYTRMRFRFFHLTSFLHVTLLVPDFEPYPEEKGGGYSGFSTNAFEFNREAGNHSDANLPGVWIGTPPWVTREVSGVSRNGLRSLFQINWRASRSSDNDPPLVQVISSTNTSEYNNNDQSPCMYMLRGVPDDVFEINVKDFYPKSDITTDRVRRYEFVGFYAGQTMPNNQPLISVRLITPGSTDAKLVEMSTYSTVQDAKFVPYFYYANTKNQNQMTGGSIDFNSQGTYQHITLYLPRKSNETILVRAKVLPWNGTFTDMNLVEREN